MDNWADLPQDVLGLISDLSILSDHMKMQCVCKTWQSFLKNSSSKRELPWLMLLPKDKEEDPDARDFFSLSKQNILSIRLPEIRGKRCCGSFQNGWLMIVVEQLDICLFHPWSKKTLQLPHQSTFKKQHYVDDEGTFAMEEIRDMHIRKAALSDDANMVLVVYGMGNLAFCRVGDKAWTEIHSGMEDVIFHKGQFYALTVVPAVYLVLIEDGVNPSFSLQRITEDFLLIGGLFYLVPDTLTDDTMFVIFRELDESDILDEDAEYTDLEDDAEPPRSLHRTIHFDIYQAPLGEVAAAPKGNKLMKVESLGDRIVFLGYNSPMITTTREFPGFQGNLIYFADNCAESYFCSPYGCCDSGVFNV